MKHGFAAVAREFFEDGFAARLAGPLVAELGTAVVAALQRLAADSSTNMFGLDVVGVVVDIGRRIERTQLLLVGLSFLRFLFPGAAYFAALVAAAVERGLAAACACGDLVRSLVALDLADHAAAATSDADGLCTGRTGSVMALLVTHVPAR